MTCPFRILGLSASATKQEVLKKFRALQRNSHPDKNPSPDATEVSKRLNDAKDRAIQICEERGGDNFESNPESEDEEPTEEVKLKVRAHVEIMKGHLVDALSFNCPHLSELERQLESLVSILPDLRDVRDAGNPIICAYWAYVNQLEEAKEVRQRKLKEAEEEIKALREAQAQLNAAKEEIKALREAQAQLNAAKEEIKALREAPRQKHRRIFTATEETQFRRSVASFVQNHLTETDNDFVSFAEIEDYFIRKNPSCKTNTTLFFKELRRQVHEQKPAFKYTRRDGWVGYTRVSLI